MNLFKKLVICLFLNISIALVAHAALHGNEQSVLDDLSLSNATLGTEALNGYTVLTLNLPSGTKVKEYLSANGQVFAVSWRGPLLPYFELILGKHIKEYRDAFNSNSGRGPLVYRQPELIIESAGHIRAFSGRAYIPPLLPQGLRPEDIK